MKRVSNDSGCDTFKLVGGVEITIVEEVTFIPTLPKTSAVGSNGFKRGALGSPWSTIVMRRAASAIVDISPHDQKDM